MARVGVVIIAVFALMAIFGPIFMPFKTTDIAITRTAEILLPRIEASTIQNGSQGSTRKKSVIRMRRLSTHPPI